MTYDEALAFWYGRVNYERSAPQVADLKLDRMRALLHRLGDPHDRLRTVHVAGSKGKGSTCAMLASVLRCAGYRTGLFTSPHLVDVRERIQIDGELIGRDELAALMTEIQPAVEALEAEGQPPTFFEVGTALGLLYFQRRGCDIAVIEVGLGGRFDSTNVITPLVSVITSISLDHTQILGDTVEKIAFEKAGIIKPGVPVVSGVTEPGPRAVIERVAKEREAPLVQLGDDIWYEFVHEQSLFDGDPHGLTRNFDVVTRDGRRRFRLQLIGDHQAANATLVVAVVYQLRQTGFPVSDSVGRFKNTIGTGLSQTSWPARCELFFTRPVAILDCAHNVASAEALAQMLIPFPQPHKVLIFAASSDKDVPGMFRVLAPHFERFYLTRYQQSTRAIPPEQLAAWLPPDKERVICPTPADAWRAACADATPDTLVVIAGSVFLAGELRPLLVEASRQDHS